MPNPLFAANRVLDQFPLLTAEDLLFLEEIAWERGALVRSTKLLGAEARITFGRKHSIISVSSQVTNHRRKRFCIAHELGHLEMHRWTSPMLFCTSQDISDSTPPEKSTVDQIEKEANAFAAALLLPDRFFAPLVLNQEPSLENIADLSEKFEVSLTATAIRYTSFCAEPIAIVFSQEQRIKWFQPSNEFSDLGVYIDVRSRLDPLSVAGKLFENASISNKPRRVAASTWLVQSKYENDASILEQSWVLKNYDAVLSLLWVDEEIYEEDF